MPSRNKRNKNAAQRSKGGSDTGDDSHDMMNGSGDSKVPRKGPDGKHVKGGSKRKAVSGDWDGWEQSSWLTCWKLCVFVIAVAATLGHRYHITNLFENDRHFSHLSSLEREMTFRTEMGLYFSYYKTIIYAPSLLEGLDLIMKDNVTEYPDTINTLKRFNLYPEVVLGALYRAYTQTADKLGWVIKQCWRTERGKNLSPIVSCEGMGDPFYFYINMAFALASTVAGTLFLYGVVLSESIFGGLIVLAGFLFNHGEATRVQWTPPLRETFGYPVFALELLAVTYVIKNRKNGCLWCLLIAMLTVSFMLPWQFAQFALSTQVGSIFVAYMLDYVPSSTLRTITLGHLVGFFVAFGFLFGNEMLLTSLFLSSLVTVQVICVCESLIYKLKFRLLIWIVQAGLFAAGTLGLKLFIGNALKIHDDAHIFDILRSKFSNYSDFHTRLYTCATEFDFLGLEPLWKLTVTLIMPAAAAAVLVASIQILYQERPHLIYWKPDPLKPFAGVVYNLIQLGAFSVMAGLIMRLKLFWTPHVCIIASLVASRPLLSRITSGWMRPIWQQAACIALIAAMAYQGIPNIQKQWKIMGEYSNPTQEDLFEWIQANTESNAVFAATMPTAANIKLSCERPIVMHPHYEDAGLRDRVMRAYCPYSRKTYDECYKILQDMKVDYLVFEYSWCQRGGKPGCSMPDLWDLHDVENRERLPICERFQKGKFGVFELVYKNPHYGVFRIEKNEPILV